MFSFRNTKQLPFLECDFKLHWTITSSHIFRNESLMTQNHIPQEDDIRNSHTNTYLISLPEVRGSYSEVHNTLFIIDTSSQSGRVLSLGRNYKKVFFLGYHPRCVSNKSNYMVYACIVKHNYILVVCSSTIYKAQLHVSATNVGHIQVVQWKTYQSVIHACVGSFIGCREG
jgi:hypothetical protein